MRPSDYAATEALRDGRSLQIRALRAEDRDALEAAVSRMSDETIYRRFFTPKRTFTEREVEFYTKVDFVNHVALVAVLPQDPEPLVVGGARYIVVEPGIAEVAFAVDDAHQGLGIGGRLMQHLTLIARSAGLRRLVAEVLAGNAAMLKVFEKSGLRVHKHREREVMHVELDL